MKDLILVSGNDFTEEDLERFAQAYYESYGESISLAEAKEMLTRVVNLYLLVARPLPDEQTKSNES
jgi:hypothetical protein